MEHPIMARKASELFGGINPANQQEDYLNKSGVDLITDPNAIRDVRSYYEGKGETFSSDSEMWDNFYSDRRWRDTNSLSMAKGAAEYALAGSSQELHSRLSKIWSNAPSRGGFFDKVIDYGTAGALDPLNLLAGAGVANKARVGYNAARAGRATMDQAIKAGTKAGAIQGAKTEAAINAGVGGAFDAAQQATEIQQGVSDEFNPLRTAASAALDGTIGAAFGGVFGAYQGKKAATDVTNWRGNTAVGNDIVRRTQRLDADIRALNDEYTKAVESGEDASDIFDQMQEMKDERRTVGKIEESFDQFDKDLDDLSRQAQTAQAENPDADISDLQAKYDEVMRTRAEAFGKPVDDIVDDLMAASRAEPTTASSADPEINPTQAAPDDAATATAPEVETPTTTARAPNVDAGEEVAAAAQATAEDVAPAAEVTTTEVKPLPEIKFGKNAQVERLVKEGKITVDELGRLVNDGELETISNGSIKARYGEGVTAYKKVQEYIARRDAGASANEAPAPTATTEAPPAKSPIEEAVVERPAQDYDMMANEQFEKLYDQFAGTNAAWSQMVPKILGVAQKEMDGQVYRRVAAKFNTVMELEKLGKSAPNAKQVEQLRAKFLDREGVTSPDVDGGTVKRSADGTAKVSDALESGPVTAGRTSEGKIQGIVRSGYSTGSEDGRTVLSAADVPDAQALSEKGAEAVKARAAMDRQQGKEKSIYPFEASGRERRGSIADGDRLQKGTAAYYVPNAKKYFASEKNAKKAAGILGDDNYEVIADAAKTQDKPVVLTDEHYAREKNAIDAKFFSDENMTTEEHSALLKELDDRAVGTSSEAASTPAPKAEALPDVAGESNGKIIAAIPRETNTKYKTARIISAKQLSEGKGLNSLLGKEGRDNWFIGYLDPSMRNKKSNIELLKSELEPIDIKNSTGVERAVEPEVKDVRAPIDADSADFKDASKGIDLADLTQEERTGLYLALKMSTSLNVGKSAKTGKDIRLSDVITLEDMKEGNFSLQQLDKILFSADNFSFRDKITLNGQEIDPGEDARMLALKTVFALRKSLAPNGIRRPKALVKDTIEDLNTRFDNFSVKDKQQIGRMFELVADEDGMGPALGDTLPEGAGNSMGMYGSHDNKIQLQNQTYTDINGGSPTFVAAHELGHWVYRNLMDDEDISTFWGAIRKQFVEEGKGLTDEGYEKIISRQPWGDGQTDFARPNEYFANQFALYMNRRHDMMMWPDRSFWDKVTQLAKRVFERLSGKATYDETLEPLFDKLITRQDEKARVTYAIPVEPKTSLGKTVRARYAMLGEHALEATRRLEMDDIENFAFAMNKIADEFNSMATTEKGAKIIAVKKGEPYNPEYTGVLEAIKPLAPRMRKAARLIKSVTGRYDQNINQSGADEISGTAFFADMEDDLKMIIGDEGIIQLVDDVLEKLNEVHQSVEFGDIPEYKMSRETADLRRRVGMEKIAKSLSMKKSIRAFRAEKARNKKFASAMVEEAKRKADPQAVDKNADTPNINPDEVDMVTASREFQNQIDSKGNLTKLGKALSRRVAHILNTEGALAYRRRTYSDLNNAELYLRYGQAIEKGNIETIEKLAYEIQVRTAPPEIESPSVGFAIQAEQDLRVGVPSETGIPAGSNYMMRNALRAITHRTEPELHAARTMANRLGLLGHDFNADVTSDAFKSFRKEVRQLASNLAKNPDITQTVRALSRRIISSQAVSREAVDDIRAGAAEFAYDADEFIINVVLDDVDMSTDSSYSKAVMDDIRSVRGNEVDDIVSSVRANVREALSYVLNGLVSDVNTRRRFLPLFTYGDMSRTVNNFDAASPSSRFTLEVPAEFAQEFADDIINNMSPVSRNAADKFTDGNVVPYFVSSSEDARLDGMTFVSRRPENTTYKEAGNIIDQSSDPERMSQVVDILTATRNSINEMRLMGDVSPGRIEAMYAREKVIREEITRLGSVDTSITTPVFIRDDKPLNLASKTTVKQPDIMEVIALIKSKEQAGRPSASRGIESTVGAFSPNQMFDMLSDAAGGARRLRSVLREAGFTSVNLPGRKAILKEEYMKPIRSNLFDDQDANMSGLKEAPSDINAHVVKEMMTRVDMGSMGFEQASMSLEIGGVPRKVLDVISKSRRSAINEQEGIELRKAWKHNLLNTNAQILRKSGMPTLADFFEPSRGGGGHFERVSANMGKFVIPMTRMLRELPDAGNFLKRWVDNGVGQMYEAGVDSGRRVLHMAPIHRSNQPNSHREILDALRDSKRMSRLSPKELEVYDYLKTYLQKALVRLKETGAPVGEIMDNYFPQIWRKDLIEADQDRFVDLMQRYFMAEAKEEGYATTREAAQAKAIKVKNRLVTTNGADSSDVLGEYNISADTDDSFDFQRQIRLDKFPQFTNPNDPANNLAAFLENDLMAVMTKYSDSLEQRLDLQKNFGPKSIGYHDYLLVQDQGLDAVTKLLSTDRVLSRELSSNLATGQRVTENRKTVLFHPPFADEVAAQQFVKELAGKARNGASRAELQQSIMARLDTTGTPSSEAVRMRKNFAYRAKAIAGALHDSNGFLNDKGQVVQVDKQNILHAEGFFRATLRKDIEPSAGKVVDMKAASKFLRSVNAVTLLGFTTLSSMGDLVLPLIRTGDFKASVQAWSKFMKDPVSGSAYRDMIRNIGAASENITHQRMTKAFGVDNTRFTSGFFTGTLLTPWTDMNRDLAAAVGYEHFRAQARIATEAPNTRQGRVAKRILDEAGLTEIYRGNLNLEAILRSNEVGEEHPYREVITAAIIKVANDSIFTPNANDLPLFAQTPTGMLLMQLKSFPLMMTRMGRFAWQEATRTGDTRRVAPLLYMAGLGPMFGAGVAFSKDVVQGRGGEENREFAVRERSLTDKFSFAEDMGLSDRADKLGGWYIDGLMQMGGLGLIGQLMYDSAAQLDNGAYGQMRVMEMFGGPSLGLFNDAFTVASGLQDMTFDALGAESTNAKERAMTRELFGRVPVIGGISSVREGAVDRLAGPKGG